MSKYGFGTSNLSFQMYLAQPSGRAFTRPDFGIGPKKIIMVVYNNKCADDYVYDFVNGRRMIDRALSMIIFDKPYTPFDNNGIVTKPGNITFSNYWSKSRVGDLLYADMAGC